MKAKLLNLLVAIGILATTNAQTLDVKSIFSKNWNANDALQKRLEPDGHYSFTSYEVIESKNELAFLSSVSSEIIIFDMNTNRNKRTIQIAVAPNDFTYYENTFYVLYDKSINLYNVNGELVESIRLPKSFDNEHEMRVIDGYIYILTSDEKTFRVSDNNFEEVSNQWIFDSNSKVHVTINREGTFAIQGTNEGGESFSGEVNLHTRIAAVLPIGIIGDNVFLRFEKFISESPIKVETRLVIYSIATGNIVHNQKLPDVFYTYIKNDFEYSNSKLYHVISSPYGIQLFELNHNTNTANKNYPFELLNQEYHYNFFLQKNQEPTPQSNQIHEPSSGARAGGACTITRTQIETNALAYRDLVWSCTSNSLRSACTDRCNTSCRATVQSKKVTTPPYITGTGTFTSVPYKWGGWTALASYNTLANQGKYVGNWLTTAMTSGVPSCPTAPDAHSSPDDNYVIGVDCSGFVTRAWGISSQKYSTASLPSISTSLSASAVEKGDIFNTNGHVRMYLSGNPTGTMTLIESAVGSSYSKVYSKSYNYSSLSGYSPYRYNNTCTSGGTNPTLVCTNAVTLSCGVTYNGSASSATSNISTYGCNNWTETGPERVHKITTTQTGTLTATISNFSGDLDVFILGSCDPSNCLGTVSSSSAIYSNAPAGTYYIVVDADDGSGSSYSLLVSCTTNNPTQPDLSVTNTSLSLGPFCAGNSVTALSTVNNTGTATAAASVMRYYLSTNTTFDGSDILLSSSNVSSISANSSSSQIVQSFNIPGGTTPGSYYVLFVADATTAVSESNENNNTAYRSLTVNNCSSPSADLAITNVDFSVSSLCAGNTISIEYDIANIGGASASTSNVKCYLSSNNTYSAGDVLLNTSSISSLSSNASNSKTITVAIPAGTTTGTWYILLIADADNTITEGTSGEANNLFYDNITITNCSGLPDIELTYNGSPPTTGAVDVTIPTNFTCENIGSAFAAASRVGYYISTDNVFDPNTDEFIDYETISSLDPGETDVESSSFRIDDCFPCGNYYIIMVADYLNVVGESNESNNIFAFPFTITGCVTCNIQIPFTGINFQSSGGTGNIAVTAYKCCEWTANTNDSWITIVNGFDYGNGTVNYAVAPCSGGGTRTGTITVGGQTHTITQDCNQSCNASQSFEWAVQAGSTTLSDEANDLAIDGSGNLYMTGDIQGSAVFGSGITLTTPSNAPDIFVSKHNSSGVIQWAVRFGNTDQDIGKGIATDNSGNVYVVGYFENSVTFGSTTLVSNATDEYAAFILKLNSAGALQWVRKINSTNSATAQAITIDASSNIYVSGDIGNSENLFVAKYNTSGTQIWFNTYGGTSNNIRNIFGTSVDNNGNLLICGRFETSITLGSFTLSNTGFVDMEGYLAKLNSSGTVLWAKKIQSPGQSNAEYNAVAVDAGNNIYAVGNVDSTAIIDNITIPLSDENKFVIAKYNQNGDALWAKASVSGLQASNFNIVKGNDGDMYVCGEFQTSMEIDTFQIVSAGSGDAFLMRIDSAGMIKWFNRYGGTLSDGVQSLATNAANEVFVAGGFRGTVNYGSTTLTSAGSEDIYLAKFRQCAPPVASITYTGSLNVCSGQTVSLSTSYCSTNTYQWQFNNVDIQGASSPSYTATQQGAYKVRVSAFAGCETISNAVNIAINSISPPTITGAATVCNSQTTLLNAGSGYTNYLWSNGATTQTTSLGAGNHAVTVTISGGCQATGYVSVTQELSPTANISYTNSGNTFNFTSNATGSPTSYSWSFGDGSTSNQENPSHTYTTTGSFTVGLTVTNSCGSNTYQETIIIGSPCNYSISTSAVIADSTGTTQTITVTTGSGCAWNVNTGNCSWLTIQPQSGSGTDTLTVTIPATNDTVVKTCSFTVEGQTVSVTQYGKLGSTGCAPVDTSVTVVNCDLAAKNVSGATYLWFKNGSPIPNSNLRFYTVTESGFYYVQISIGNCVYASSDHYINVATQCIVGIEDLLKSTLAIYPNPNKGTFKITADVFTDKPIQLKLFTALGQIVYTSEILPVANKLDESIFITGLSVGVYHLQLMVDSKPYYKKLMIE